MEVRIKIIACIALLHISLVLHAQTGSQYVKVPGGTYQVGKNGHLLNPLRKVQVNTFYIATTEVTNEQFYAFIKSTGYITDAERLHNAMVFMPGLQEFEWKNDSSASWRHPNGRGKDSIDNKWDHPVTCISYTDALVYCKWAGVRLPSLDEWEIACRAGSGNDYFFGGNNKNIGQYANIWHGRDHLVADSSDRYMYTAPVAHFKANAWGLYDMYGNVFEFCTGKLPTDKSDDVVHARGGSWWCSRNACNFFNSYDIGRVHRHASFSNQGFRVVK
jgi:formylglycine-generating enzyme